MITKLMEGKGLLYIPGESLTEGYFKDGELDNGGMRYI